MTKPERGGTRVEVVPPVAGIGYGHRRVFAAVTVRMTDERAFPVVVEPGVSDSDTRASMGDVKKAVVAGNTIELEK